MSVGLVVVLSQLVLLYGTRVRAEIVIEQDDWGKFIRRDGAAGATLPEVVTTADGLTSLHMTRPSADKFVTYKLNVTQLPAGKTRFPVQVLGRQVQDFSNGLGIRNLTIDPEANPAGQTSFIAILMNDGGAGGPARARDDRNPFNDADLPGTIGRSGTRVDDPTLSTEFDRADLTTTVNATLELRKGENILRIDPTDPRDLPAYAPDCGWQAFRIVIGPGDADLQGSVVVDCSVTRTLSPTIYSPGDTVTVALAARNISNDTTISESFPLGWSVVSNGGGIVAGSLISFEVDTDATLTYEVQAPADPCETVRFSGDYSDGADCDGETTGDSSLDCLGGGGIAIDGGDWNKFVQLDSDPGSAPPRIVTTGDGVTTLLMPPQDNGSYKAAIYAVNVTQLPADKSRFPVAFLSRNVGQNGTGVGIRNVSISEEFYPLGTWLSVFVGDGGLGAPLAKDELGMEDPPGSIGISGARVEDPFLGTDIAPFGAIVTAQATLKLQLGINLLYIEPVDARDLPGAVGYDSGYQFTTIRIGPDETDLTGEIVEACGVTRSLASHYLPGESLEVMLTTRNISGETTIVETFPTEWSVVNDGGGDVEGNTLAFNVDSSGTLAYTLSVPEDFCQAADVTGTFIGAGDFCEGNVFGSSSTSCATGCRDLFISGAVSEMLIIGPIDLSDGGQQQTGPDCDDNGDLGTTDYLDDDVTDESNLMVQFGDELRPDFGGLAGGFGVASAPNPAINPRRDEDILTVWVADADGDGRIAFNDADNIGNPLDDYLVYAFVYLVNTTAAAFDVTLDVGSDDANKVRVNGELQQPVNAGCHAIPPVGGGNNVPVTLEPGLNTVLIAVVERGGLTDVRLIVRRGFGPLTDGSVVSCLAPPDVDEPPGPPANLTAAPGDSSVFLDWDDSPEKDLAGYNVYRSTTPGGPYALLAESLSESEYTDGTVENDTTYYYVVTGVDQGDNESAFSREAEATPTQAGGSQVPGDCNQDGRYDLSDLICITTTLFIDASVLYPCGNGLPTAPGNISLLDSNGDGRVDLSDAVHGAGFQFGSCGSPPCPPHSLGTECIAIVGCEESHCDL